MPELTQADLAERIEGLERMIVSVAGMLKSQGEFQAFLAHRFTDLTHVTIAEAANILKVSVKTVRRRIDDKVLTLETVPGTKEMGIPLRQLRPDWIPVRALATAKERDK